MHEPYRQTSVAVATKTKVGVTLATKVALSLGVLGTTAAFAAAAMPGAADDGGSLFELRTKVVASVSGSGTVTSSPAGITCPGKCSAPFPIGATVVLNTTPSANAIFAGWSGACSGDGGCSFEVRPGAKAAATFQERAPMVTLKVAIQGQGRVNSNPGGIACGFDCSEAYTLGTTVTLTAIATPGMRFAGWGEACSGTAAKCVATLTGDATATARFVPLPPAGGS